MTLPRLPGSLLVLALVAGGCAVGCVSESESSDADANVAAIVQSKVHVIDAEPGKDFDVTDKGIAGPRERFTETYATGDVIVSGKGTGLMRRVRATHVDGDRVVIDTDPAALTDVFHQVHLHGKLNDAQPEPSTSKTQGLTPQGLIFRLPKLEVSHKKLEIGNNSSIELVDGSFDFQPDVDFDLLMREGKLQHLLVKAGGSASGDLRVRYDLHKPPGVQSGGFVRFDNSGVPLFETEPYYAVYMAGWVPVVVAVRARLLANWQLTAGGDFTGEQALTASGSLVAGLEYTSDQWKNISASSLGVSADGAPTVANHQVSGEVTLTARIDVSFYDVAGPYVGLQGYAGIGHQASASDTGWFAEYGMRGLAGAQVAVFGKALVGYEAVLFDLHKQTPL